MTVLTRLWLRIHQPRVISVLYFLIYLCLAAGGLLALLDPPASLAGQIGTAAMSTLSALLTFGGIVGAFAALPGIWWLERTAVLSIGLASALYAIIIFTLHATTPGNRLLQLSFVATVALMQIVRWHRIRVRPYDPDRVPPTV